MKTVLFAALAVSAAFVPALAQHSAPADGKGFYAGAGVTHTEHDWMAGKSNSLKLFGGYDFNDRWGIEAGTSRQGKWSFTYPSDYSGNQFTTSSFKGRTSYLAAKFTTPLTDMFALETKLGVAHNSGKFHFVTSGVPGPYDESSSNDGLYAGFGLKYKITPRMALSLDLERNGKQLTGGQKNEAVSLNASFKF
jgi:outer membrane autotransporter protein